MHVQSCCFACLRACLHGGGGPQAGEVKYGGSPHLSCKRDQIKVRDYMNKRVTPPPCKQALKPIAFLPFSLPLPSSLRKLPNIRELKQQRRRRLRKRHLKSEFALLQTLSILFQLVQFVKCWHFFLELNSKRLYRSSGKEKESRCLVFTSSTKREIRHFHDVVVQRRQRNVQKSVMHVQSCCFANPNPLLFCRSR